MDHLRNFKFYLDGNLITPRDLHYSFKTKILTYSIEVEIGYLDKHDGRFHFTASFDTNVICDIGLDKKKKSVVSQAFSNEILFDGFSDADTGKELTKSMFLKSLKKIKELTDNPDQIKRAEEQNPEIEIDIYKCQRKPVFGQPCYNIPSNSNKTFSFGSALRGGGVPQESRSVSKPVFVETAQVNSSTWKTVDCAKEEKIMSVKIIIIIVEKVEEQKFKVI